MYLVNSLKPRTEIRQGCLGSRRPCRARPWPLTSHIWSWKKRRSFSISSAISAPLISVRIIPWSLACSFFSFSILVLQVRKTRLNGHASAQRSTRDRLGWHKGSPSLLETGQPPDLPNLPGKEHAFGHQNAKIGLKKYLLPQSTYFGPDLGQRGRKSARVSATAFRVWAGQALRGALWLNDPPPASRAAPAPYPSSSSPPPLLLSEVTPALCFDENSDHHCNIS